MEKETKELTKNLIPPAERKDWDLPQALLKESNRTRLVEMLTAINRINNTSSYYIHDSHARKIIVDSPTSTILCGYKIDVAEKLGFAFYERLFDKQEWERFKGMFTEIYKVFYNHPPAKRKHLTSCFDFTVQHVGKGDLILQHKATPLLLCDNGNLWLNLCSVTESSQKQLGKTTITNTETGELYEYTKGQFVLSAKRSITDEDLLILELMGNDLNSESIAEQLDISMSTYKRKRLGLFDKLDVKSSGGAIHKAHLMGII